MSHQLDTPLSSRLIFLDSDDRMNTTDSASTCLFKMTQPIVMGTEDVHILMSLDSISIPLSMKLVNKNTNVLILTVQGTTYTETIPNGNYSITQLLTYLNALSCFSSNSIIATYSSITNLVTITAASSSTTITMGLGTINRMLGFSDITTQLSVGGILVGPYDVDMSGTRSIYVDSNIGLSNHDSQSGGGFGSILARICVNQRKGTILNYVNNTDFRSLIRERSITNIQITLRDDDRNVLDYDANEYWAATLRIDFISGKKTPLLVTLKDTIANVTLEDVEN